MKTLKNYVLYILLVILTTFALVFTGFIAIQGIEENETKKSSFTLTNFDYLITSPSKDQINQFKSNTEAIDSIFPCYSFNTTLKGNSNSKTTLLLSDDMDHYETGLFNDSTKISGDFSADGICLDKTAADNLNVTVGDTVSATLAYTKFEFKVSAIYMASTYRNMDSGLALAKYSSNISNAFGKELTYNCAFIQAKDEEKCAKLLSDYIPLGLLQSKQDYIDEYKENNKKPSSMTDEEWEKSIETAYENYKSSYLKQSFTDAVQKKSDYMTDVIDQTLTQSERVRRISIVVSVAIPLIYPVILFFLTIYTNKQKDEQDENDGCFSPSSYYLSSIVGTILVSVITLGTLLVKANAGAFSKDCLAITLYLSLPVLIAIPIVCILIHVYSTKIKNTIIEKKKVEKKKADDAKKYIEQKNKITYTEDIGVK